MGLFEHDSSAGRLPVSLITGFLGSGKTTLLNRLLRHPDTGETAVIVNEFGEIAIDHLLVEAIDGETVVLNSGCVCCALRDDLVTSLRQLYARRAAGELPPFARVLIETTGLADPAPILQMLLNNPMVSNWYRLDAVITTVDAVHGGGQLAAQPEAVKQVALADRLLLTKGDIAERSEAAALRARLADVNPTAALHEIVSGEIAPALLFGASAAASRSGIGDHVSGPQAAPSEGHEDHGHAHHSLIASFTLELDQAVEWRLFSRWLADLRRQCGERLLRLKGLVEIEGEEQPLLIQGVHHVFHPPVLLDRWPEGGRGTRLVFITRDLPRDLVLESWEDYRREGAAPVASA